jgi:hypothetical protein
MPFFTTRVELQDADDHEHLRVYMGLQSFTNTVVGSDGVEYHLPPAEYHLEGNYTTENVREMAHWAARMTGKSCKILVTEGMRDWIGLKEVARQRAGC